MKHCYVFSRIGYVFLVFVVFFLCASSGAQDSLEAGKPMEKWLVELRQRNESDVRNMARLAFQNAGTNAVSFLMGELYKLESLEKTNYATLPVVERFSEIRSAFAALGTNAEIAVPSLVAVMDRGKLTHNAVLILTKTGPKGMDCLLQALTNGTLMIRISVVSALTVETNAVSAIPGLIECLNYENASEDPQSVTALQDVSASALGQIHTKPDVVVPVLTSKLKSDRWPVRFRCAQSLARFGKEARAAVPALLEMSTNDSNSNLRVVATSALKKIQGE